MKNSNNKKKGEAAAASKDYYSRVIIWQIILSVLLFCLFRCFVLPDQALNGEISEKLGAETFDTREIVSVIKNYFTSEGSWAVFAENVTYISGEKESTTSASEATEVFDGTGGEDIDIYEAADNTSFARLKMTSPAMHPIENGRYTSFFGYRINPITGRFSFHTGLDIACAEGTKIRAAYSGRVTKTGEDDRAGKYIFLSHDDGLVTFYCHCSEILADEGAVIRQGETIARVGSTGWSTGPHLHFEVRKDNIRYNPIHILENDS